jgi:8-oxo-dGTP diphosphatase
MRNIVNALLLRQGSVLLARRSPHRKAYPGLWSFPGGHVEAGETLEQALIREVSEEVNVAPVTYSAVARIADPNTTSESITYHIYVVREWSGQPSIIDDEHTELLWFTLEEARTLSDLALEDYRPLFNSLRLAGI